MFELFEKVNVDDILSFLKGVGLYKENIKEERITIKQRFYKRI